MKVYLAANYNRRHELSTYATRLEEAGVTITSRWVYSDEAEADETFEVATDETEKVSAGVGHALKDIADIDASDYLVAFALPSDTPMSPALVRGGRHVEFGFALGRGKHLIVVGAEGGAENVFHCLPGVIRLPDFEALLALCKKHLRTHPPTPNQPSHRPYTRRKG